MAEVFFYLIGPDSNDIAWWQMVIRSFIIFVFGLTLIRLGARRMFGRNTPFDVVLAIVIGSILSRVITGNAPFFGTLAAAVALVGLHWLTGTLAFHSDWMGTLAKGRKRTLIENGKRNWKAMRRSQVGEKDLEEALRLRGELDESRVKHAYLERGGDISVIVGRKQSDAA